MVSGAGKGFSSGSWNDALAPGTVTAPVSISKAITRLGRTIAKANVNKHALVAIRPRVNRLILKPPVACVSFEPSAFGDCVAIAQSAPEDTDLWLRKLASTAD